MECKTCSHRKYHTGKENLSVCELSNEYVYNYVQLQQRSPKCLKEVVAIVDKSLEVAPTEEVVVKNTTETARTKNGEKK